MSWETKGSISAGRNDAGQADTSKGIVVAGGKGRNAANQSAPFDVTEIYKDGVSRLVGKLGAARTTFRLGVLKSGNLLASGGNGKEPRGEVFDVAGETWKFVGALPAPIYAYAAVGEYVIGGLAYGPTGGAGAAQRAIYRFDEASGQYTKVTDMLDPRCFPAAVEALDGRIYIFGGSRSGGSSENFVAVQTVEVFDPVTKKCSSAGSMNVATTGLGAVRMDDGKIGIFGGMERAGSKITYHRNTQVFDPATGQFSSAPDMPTAKSNMAYANVPGVGIVSVGGENAPNHPIAGSEVFANGAWTAIASPASARYGATLGIDGGKPVAIGGRGANVQNSATWPTAVEVYS